MAVDRRPIDQMVLDVGATAFLRLARLFEEETRGAVVEIRRRLAAGDWRELGRQAHSLKNSTSSFGLVRLAEVAARIEAAADSRQSADAERQIERLESEVGSDLAALDFLLKQLGA